MNAKQAVMRTELIVNERRELTRRDGTVVGRIVELVVELDDESAGELLAPPKGEFFENVENNTNVNSNNNVKSKEVFFEDKESRGPSPQVAEVWALYSQLISSRRKLGPKQRRDIERALALCELETVKAAVVGLSRSPWHNGKNDTGTKYLDIRFALRGNSQRGESIEERVDRMAEFASSSPSSPTTRDRGVLEGRISSLKADIRRCANARYELTEEYLAQRQAAIRDLYGFGILVKLDEHGWPSYEDIS